MLTFLGGGRGCAGALTRPSTRHLLPKNFEKTALRKRGGIFAVKMGGGHNCGNYCTGCIGCTGLCPQIAGFGCNLELAPIAPTTGSSAVVLEPLVMVLQLVIVPAILIPLKSLKF